MSVESYLQDIVVGLWDNAPCRTASIPVSLLGGSSYGTKDTDSYLMTVDIISASKKCDYPLTLIGNLNGVHKCMPFYQATEESGAPLFQLFVRNDGVPIIKRILDKQNSNTLHANYLVFEFFFFFFFFFFINKLY